MTTYMNRYQPEIPILCALEENYGDERLALISDENSFRDERAEFFGADSWLRSGNRFGAGGRNSECSSLQHPGIARFDQANQRQHYRRNSQHRELECSVDNGRGQRNLHDSCREQCIEH